MNEPFFSRVEIKQSEYGEHFMAWLAWKASNG